MIKVLFFCVNLKLVRRVLLTGHAGLSIAHHPDTPPATCTGTWDNGRSCTTWTKNQLDKLHFQLTLTPALTHSLTHTLTPSFTYSLAPSSTHSCTHSLTHTLTPSFTYSLAPSSTHSFTHITHLVLTHSPSDEVRSRTEACAPVVWYPQYALTQQEHIFSETGDSDGDSSDGDMVIVVMVTVVIVVMVTVVMVY